MTPEEFKDRTQAFALRVIRMVVALPTSAPTEVISRQVIRAATSVGANYRAACRARSKAEFRAKLGIVEEEADECLYWFDLLVKGNFVRAERVRLLRDEGDAILSMVVASIRTAKRR